MLPRSSSHGIGGSARRLQRAIVRNEHTRDAADGGGGSASAMPGLRSSRLGVCDVSRRDSCSKMCLSPRKVSDEMSFEVSFPKSRTADKLIRIFERDGVTPVVLVPGDVVRFKAYRRDQAVPVLDVDSAADSAN